MNASASPEDSSSVITEREDTDLLIGIDLGSGAFQSLGGDMYFGVNTGKMLTQKNAWTLGVAYHMRQHRYFSDNPMEALFRIDGGIQAWFGGRFWARTSLGVAAGGLLVDDSAYQAQSISDGVSRPSVYLFPTWGTTLGYYLYRMDERFSEVSRQGIVKRSGVLGFVRAGTGFAPGKPHTVRSG